MSEIKHTPGPWSYEAGQEDFVYDAKGNVVADTWYYACGEKSEANARLIATAPDLLEAANWAANYIDTILDPNAWKVLDSLRAAIAKATGSQS
jgi:hypothetical protein